MRENITIYRARILNPVDETGFEECIDGALAVDASGAIIACGGFDGVRKACVGDKTGDGVGDKAKGKDRRGSGRKIKTVTFKDALIIPGLVDCHLHLPQLDQRGKHGATLLDWLQKYIFPAESAFSDLKIAEDVAKRFFKKLILNGTTTSCVYTTVHAKSTNLAFEIAKASGLRVIMGKVMMDQHTPNGLGEATAVSIKESVKLYEKWHGTNDGRLFYAFTPRFAPTCSERMWAELGRLMKSTDAYLQTHLSETKGEVARVRELFPSYDDYTGLIERNGCLTDRTILAHVIYVSADECRRLAASRASVAHCPTSNFFLKSGRMPVELVEKAGLNYGYGTDIGAGTSMSLFTCMRHADYIQPKVSITPTKAFYHATLGGALALSMDKKIGNFEKGKRADFCVVDIKGIDPRYKLADLSGDEVLSLLMYRAGSGVIRGTYVDGKRLDVDSIILG